MRIAQNPSEPDVAHVETSDWKQKAKVNLVSLGLSKAVSGAIALLLTAYLTRVLGASSFGILGFGTALLSYFILFVRLGFPTLATREIARTPERAKDLAGQFLGMQLVLVTIGIAVYAPLVLALPKSVLFKTVLLIQGVGLLAHATSLEWLFLGIQRTWHLGIRNVAVSILNIAAVLLLVHSPADVTWAAAAAVASLFVGNGWLIVATYRRYGMPRLRIDVSTWKAHLGPALPIAASTFLIAVYYNLDQVMLGFMRSEAEVGWYTAAYKGVTAALLPATVIAQSFFPTLSIARGDAPSIHARMKEYARSMLLVGFPIAAAASILGGPLFLLFAGPEFQPATFAFVLLMANVAVVYLSMIYGQPLLAWDRQAVYMFVVGGGALLNIALNFALIPPYGVNGAALATVSAETIVLLGVFTFHYRHTHQMYAGVLFKSVLSTIVGIVIPAIGFHIEILPLWMTLVLMPLTYYASARTLRLIPKTGLISTFVKNRTTK